MAFSKHLAGALLALCLSTPALAATEMLDQVVAIVDDDVVMASELRERISLMTETLQARGAEMPPEEVIIRETLDRLIIESIQMQMAQRYGVRISDQQLDLAMSRLAAQNGMNLQQFRDILEREGRSFGEMREGMRREMVMQRVQTGNVNQRVQISEQEINNYLATEEGQKMVQPEYRVVHALLPLSSAANEVEVEAARRHSQALLDRIRSGEPFDSVLASSDAPYRYTGGDLGWRKLDDLPSIFQDVAPRLEVGETADLFRSPSGWHLVNLLDRRGAKTTVRQTQVRHILLKPSEILTDAQARSLAAELRERIENGEDFAALAREYSGDIGTAQEGGDLGWTSPGQMVPGFENAMESTEIGTISPPVRSQFGWHIIEVLDRRDQDMTEAMRRGQVREFLHSRKYQEELDAWLRKIRDEAFVDIK